MRCKSLVEDLIIGQPAYIAWTCWFSVKMVSYQLYIVHITGTKLDHNNLVLHFYWLEVNLILYKLIDSKESQVGKNAVLPRETDQMLTGARPRQRGHKII